MTWSPPRKRWTGYRRWRTWRFFNWLFRVVRGDKLLIDYRVGADLKFDETLRIENLSIAQVYSLGYIRGRHIRDEVKYMFFKTFVKFSPLDAIPYPVMITGDDQVQRPNRETSSTLYDFWRSDSIREFLKGMMTKIGMPAVTQKQIVMLACIALAAALGVYFVIMR